MVKRFWKVMEGLDNKDRSQFLRFTWGRSRLPHKDNWPRPFKLVARNYGDDMLPLAHTCFFELELPQYSTDQILRKSYSGFESPALSATFLVVEEWRTSTDGTAGISA